MGLRDRPASQRGTGDILAMPRGPDLSEVEGDDYRRGVQSTYGTVSIEPTGPVQEAIANSRIP